MKHYTIQQFHEQFPDNNACLEHLFHLKFKDPICTHCKRTQFYRHTKRACFVCACGKTQYYPKQGTIFQKSSTDLVKWFYAIFLMSQSRNGVAAKEIERHIGVTYKCAWRMAKQIRSLMKENPWVMHGTVEVDETIISSKRGAQKRGEMGMYAGKKAVVIGMVERGGRLNVEIIDDVKKKSIVPVFQDSIAKGSLLITDGLNAYRTIALEFQLKHESVDHSSKEYAKGIAHTNTIEGFWGQLKRSINGTYHVISEKYLPLYLQEFQFRYNYSRSVVHIFDVLLARL